MVPILLWTISGFLHPVMNSFKPAVRNQALPSIEIDTARINIPLHQALQQHGIKTLHNFRIVKLYEVYYYQVQHPDNDTLTYINCQSGNILVNGDKTYAAYLAQRFLSEPLVAHKSASDGHHHAMAGAFEVVSSLSKPTLSPKCRIINTKLITKFDKEYKGSNKLLPVYRVNFERDDHIRLYVETVADRLALAMDDRKAAFTNFFSLTHSWSFLNNIGKTKSVLLGTFSALCFLTSVFGFYVYFISNKKKIKPVSFTHRNRKWHRTMGSIFLTTTLLFSFSGAWHAWKKITHEPKRTTATSQLTFQTTELNLSLRAILESFSKGEKLTGISAIKIKENGFWQVSLQKGKTESKKYISMIGNNEMKQGDAAYAVWLACQFSGKTPHNIIKAKELNSFTHGYSMMNKRLPVVQVSFDKGDQYFIETSTGKLAAVSRTADRWERFSFSNFHMHHYWEMWLGKENGKTVRNVVLLLSTLGLLLVALTGTVIYYRKRYQRKI
jgi:hypothetical protein